jgi:predicted permease
VLGEALNMLGAPLIPCLFLVLGANLAQGPGAAQVRGWGATAVTCYC